MQKVDAKYRLDRKKRNIIKHKNLLSHIRMGKEIVMFDDIENDKNKFYRHKSRIFLKDVDIEKVLVSNKISSDEKSYKFLMKKTINTLLVTYHDHKGKPLHAKLPKVSSYVKSYDGQTKWMYFLVEDDDLLQEHAIWDRVSADIKKIDSKPVYNEKI